MSDEKTKAKDKGNEHIYFTVTPRLVWALSEDPYEYTFWCVIKDIAGEDGQCILSRDDLAALAMMSGGKASECRDRLIEKKLLIGEFKKDPGYPQPVWHLTIPDFWEANVRWARKYPKIEDRVRFKREQATEKRASRGDGSKEMSPSDGGIPPNDGGIPPGDLKKNVVKNQKEEEDTEKEIFISALQFYAVNLFPKDYRKWDKLEKKIRTAQTVVRDGVLVISGLGIEAAWLEDHYAKSFNNLLRVNTHGGFTSLTFQE